MTRAEIIRLLKHTGLKPQTAAGQHFLLDESIPARMVAAANVVVGDRVLEIGPGFGILTEALLNAGAEVVAIELDKRLADYLRKRFKAHPGIKVIEQDIFKVNLHDYVPDGDYKVVANLPYSATSLVFRNFLTLPPRPTSMTVMIQREVARRLTAKPGDHSVLSIISQYFATIDHLFDVPPELFFPVPAVVSSVVQCHDLRTPDPAEADRFVRMVKIGFSARRKQLKNTLAAGLKLPAEKIDAILKKSTISPTLRAQDLSIQDWLTLALLEVGEEKFP